MYSTRISSRKTLSFPHISCSMCIHFMAATAKTFLSLNMIRCHKHSLSETFRFGKTFDLFFLIFSNALSIFSVETFFLPFFQLHIKKTENHKKKFFWKKGKLKNLFNIRLIICICMVELN